MKLSNNFSFKLVIAIIVVFYNYSVLVSAVPQWVWNPDANSVPPSGGNNIIFGSQTSAADSTKDKAATIKIVDTQARLFPSIVSAISNSINGNNNNNNNNNGGSGGSVTNPFPGGGSGGSGGGGGNSCNPPNSGACIGSQIAQVAIENGINAGSAVAQNPSVGGIFGSILQNIFGGASTLPAGIGGSGSGGNKDPGSGSGGTCDGGRTNCCVATRGSRTIFPDEGGNRGSSSTKSVTRSQIRRALFKNIVRGSGSLIDDTIDLVLHPFLTKEDQLKVATRVLSDD
ncbi:hypothetical protein Ocin01_09238 [Orchesella cincta]|uniref:Uncharacterized protein n=1 Tax=Orchesella cincta TaxID=48709 RepID=A0A1D2MWJ9_ORCCI|nr:hypothetical protein Ocin01_09238 [Orchesella cincta]